GNGTDVEASVDGATAARRDVRDDATADREVGRRRNLDGAAKDVRDDRGDHAEVAVEVDVRQVAEIRAGRERRLRDRVGQLAVDRSGVGLDQGLVAVDRVVVERAGAVERRGVLRSEVRGDPRSVVQV